jgi:hypothetical protein
MVARQNVSDVKKIALEVNIVGVKLHAIRGVGSVKSRFSLEFQRDYVNIHTKFAGIQRRSPRKQAALSGFILT